MKQKTVHFGLNYTVYPSSSATMRWHYFRYKLLLSLEDNRTFKIRINKILLKTRASSSSCTCTYATWSDEKKSFLKWLSHRNILTEMRVMLFFVRKMRCYFGVKYQDPVTGLKGGRVLCNPMRTWIYMLLTIKSLNETSLLNPYFFWIYFYNKVHGLSCVWPRAYGILGIHVRISGAIRVLHLYLCMLHLVLLTGLGL